MTIKEIFEKAENGTLTYEQFEQLHGNSKFADLSEGNYVSKGKYEAEIQSKESQIKELNDTISKRDTDLSDLKSQLEQAGTDASKLTELQTQFDTLKGKYDTETKQYQDKLSEQAYDFAVKEYANGKKFSSGAAKRDFISEMKAKKLQMDGDKIIGADDFLTAYTKDNEDAFITETKSEPKQEQNQPHFVSPTSGNNPNPQQQSTGGFNFHFVGVRPEK